MSSFVKNNLSLKLLPVMSALDGPFNLSVSSTLSIQLAKLLEERTTAEYDSTDCAYRVRQATAVSIGEEGTGSPSLRIDADSPMGSIIKLPESPSYAPTNKSRLERVGTFLDLAVSPLTCSSYHTMERYYDQDTWRMHNRIAASRSDRPEMLGKMPNTTPGHFLESTEESRHQTHQSSQPFFEHDEDQLDGEGDDDDDLEVFDLDLDES